MCLTYGGRGEEYKSSGVLPWIVVTSVQPAKLNPAELPTSNPSTKELLGYPRNGMPPTSFFWGNTVQVPPCVCELLRARISQQCTS